MSENDPFSDPVFAPGDTVTPKYVDGYHLTMGKAYIVEAYEAEVLEPHVGFTWPAYVTVRSDIGVPVIAHARRFKPYVPETQA